MEIHILYALLILLSSCSHRKFVQHADQSEFKLMVQLDSDLQQIRKPRQGEPEKRGFYYLTACYTSQGGSDRRSPVRQTLQNFALRRLHGAHIAVAKRRI
jgi:hypothetical protein